MNLYSRHLLIGLMPLWLLTTPAPAHACEPWLEQDPERLLEIAADASSLVVGHISVRNSDLFDLSNSRENGFIHSAANALHLITRESTLLAALPFRSGDSFTQATLAEGERILRAKRYLRDAVIVPIKRCDNRVDVEVRTVDNWTLTPSLSFGSAGGESRYAFELQDLNVLGLGKELKFRSSRAGGIRKTTFVYGDENVLGSRYQFRVGLGDSDEGSFYNLETGLPFYSSATQRSWWLSADSNTRLTSEGLANESTTPVKTETIALRIANRVSGSSLSFARWGAGIRLQRQTTGLESGDTFGNPAFDFSEAYPFLSTQWSQSDWAKRQNFAAIGQTEDIDLGYSVDIETGFLLEGFGNERDALRLDLALNKGWAHKENSLHKLTLEQTQYFDNNDPSKYELSVRYQYFHWLTPDDQIDIRLVGQTHRGYSPAHRFKIGGEYGLKAYPNKFQTGDNRVVGLAEYRHVTGWSPWSLVRTAFTTFFEAGRAWSDGDSSESLADVGVGLILSPTRGSRAAINRFDISVPLVDGEGVGDFQIFIGSQLVY